MLQNYNLTNHLDNNIVKSTNGKHSSKSPSGSAKNVLFRFLLRIDEFSIKALFDPNNKIRLGCKKLDTCVRFELFEFGLHDFQPIHAFWEFSD